LVCVIIGMSIIFWSCSSDRSTPYENSTIETKPPTPKPPTITKVVGEEGISYAFTDLVFFDNQWFVTFRKSNKHILGENGIIQIYSSLDGENWNFIKEFSVKGIDLRDPKFSVNNDALFLYIHGSTYKDGKLTAFSDYNTTYTVAAGFQELKGVYLDNLKSNIAKIEGNEAWPWRVTWYKGKAYTIGYNENGIFDIYSSDDGNFFKNLNAFKDLAGNPNEATLRVDNNGEFFVLARRLNASTMIGRTFDPNSNWDWSNEHEFQNFGGPNFVFTKENKMILSGRLHTWVSLTAYDLLNKKISVLTSINSKMDCGYPGMMIKGDYLWLSYYSAHENTLGSSIYVLKINLKQLGYN
jgi:hypothetical protein